MGARTADLVRRALGAHQRGDIAGAETSYQAALTIDADDFDALHMLGVIRLQQRRHDEALRLIERALRRKPRSAEAHANLGIVLHALNRFADAMAAQDRALAINPRYVNAHLGRGNALLAMKRHAEAIESFDRALGLDRSCGPALINLGVALRALDRHEEALAAYDRLLAIAPRHAETLYNRGNSLHALGRFEEALACYDGALAASPTYVEALNNRGHTLNSMHRHEEALVCFHKALTVASNFAAARLNAGNALQALDRHAEAVASYDTALAIEPENADIHYNRATSLLALNRHADAVDSYERAVAFDPKHLHAPGALLFALLLTCNWAKVDALAEQIADHVDHDRSIVTPFTSVAFFSDPERQLTCSRNLMRRRFARLPAPCWRSGAAGRDRIRLGYLSADFRLHPTAYLIAQLLELHDRARFEVIGISFGRDDGSDIRSRVVKAFDGFHDVTSRSDRDVAMLMADLGVDIAIDLNGHIAGNRLGILAHRPAPIQVNLLGYPGTIGAEFIDYVIADRVVLPPDQQQFYTERIVRLPDCYQVSDSTRVGPPSAPMRRAVGLPENAFVFCCFNQSYKITASMFDVWMRLLDCVDASVLWLFDTNEVATRNLRNEAAARGLDPDRLVFARRSSIDDHLARHRLADLFLDTLPYNAHTTANDALWVGVPVVTCKGRTFAGRVAASLLEAVGLPELVTENLADYESLALALATDRPRLQAIRRKLEQGRARDPLFDTDRYRRHIEAAYGTMWTLWQSGAPPRSFAVEPTT